MSIIATDSHNANRDYKNQGGYRLPNLGEIYHIPSTIKREWKKMSAAEKFVYGAIFASTVIGLGIAADYKYNGGKTVKNIGDYSKNAGKKIGKGISAADSGFFFGGQPHVAFVGIEKAANESAAATAQPTATPAPDFLIYEGIKINGDEQFQKDNVMWLEFAKKYSLPDYEFIKSKNKWIKGTDFLERKDNGVGGAGAGGDGFYWNKKFLGELIENKKIKEAVEAAAHESGHNSVFNTDRMNETYANIFYLKAYTNLSYVNQSEIDKFYQEFNFSQLKK